jgi:hypothetical protein
MLFLSLAEADKIRSMKLQYTVRDMLWLMLLSAIVTAWWIDHRRLWDLLETAETEETVTTGTTIQLPEFSYSRAR